MSRKKKHKHKQHSYVRIASISWDQPKDLSRPIRARGLKHDVNNFKYKSYKLGYSDRFRRETGVINTV